MAIIQSTPAYARGVLVLLLGRCRPAIYEPLSTNTQTRLMLVYVIRSAFMLLRLVKKMAEISN